MFNKKEHSSGFTLIELLVVIAIVGILVVGLIVAINPAKQIARSKDTARKSAVRDMSAAIQRYMVTSIGVAPINRAPGRAYYSNEANFLQELITSGELKSIPKDPGGGQYAYYDYGSGNNVGTIVVTTLEGIDNTTVGPDGSCRPFDQNWCSSTIPSKYYCLCNPY